MTTKSRPSTKPESRAARVLVMDDENFIRDLVSKILQRLGHEVDGVADADDAISLYRAAIDEGHCYDAVILDLTIPGGRGGKEVIAELKQIDPEVKALVSSGYSTDPVLADYKAHGFAGIVNKPYRPKELAEAISQLLPSVELVSS